MDLNQITIPVLNMDRSIEFYQKLGLKLIVSSTTQYARFQCIDGNSTFSLHKVEKLPGGDGVWVYFEHSDLDNKVRELQARGIVFDQLPKDEPWLWREARLRDPDNNQIILYYAGKNRVNPPWRIKE